jgi:hypothetical protein
VSKITGILFILIVTELALGGGGRLIAFGPISLRMVLFALAILLSGWHFVKEKYIPSDYLVLLLMFTILSFLALLRGIDQGAPFTYWWEDIKPLSYFYILPFFYFAIKSNDDVMRTALIFKICGIILAFSFFLILILIHSGIIPFLDFYSAVIDTQEFFFRGEITFLYKGFLFLCVSFIFIQLTDSKYKLFFLALLLIAIIGTVTRGFWFALLLTYSVYYYSISKKLKSILFGLLAFGVVYGGQIVISKTSESIDQIRSEKAGIKNTDPKSNLLGDRHYSDDGRIAQIKEVANLTTFTSLIIGHGFGNGTTSRPVHMEISFLEIFHKQGILGLLFWVFLFWVLIKKYLAAPASGLRNAFFYASLFVFIQSLTNQYVNNPIGLSVVLLSIVCLDLLKIDLLIKD